MTPEQRHINMASIRGRNTAPEQKVRKWLHGQGFRFRVNVRRLPGTPDIVLAKYRTCIFVNGCFWHGHNGCRSFTHPKTNPDFWEEKVRRNSMRDQVVEAKLEAMRWKVLTIWECELKKDSFGQTMEQVVASLLRNREDWLCDKARRRTDREIVAARKDRNRELSESLNVPKHIRELAEKE